MTSNGPLSNEGPGKRITEDDQKELNDHPNFGLTKRFSYDPFESDDHSSVDDIDDVDDMDDEETPFYRQGLFLITVALVLLMLCVAILIIRPFPVSDKPKTIPTPYYDQPSLQFPAGMKDWKFSIDRYDNYVYKCLMQQDEAWHDCYPVLSTDTGRG